MSCLEGLLRQRIAAGEAALQGALRTPFSGILVRNFLPQTWVVITDQETLSVHVDEAGSFTVRAGDSIGRDGAVAARHDVLAAAIRSRKDPPATAFHVRYYTQKGEAAFEQLSKYSGL